MIYAVALSSFAIGFSLATILICRVTLNLKARRTLNHLNLLPLHKAKVPRREMEEDSFLHRPI